MATAHAKEDSIRPYRCAYHARSMMNRRYAFARALITAAVEHGRSDECVSTNRSWLKGKKSGLPNHQHRFRIIRWGLFSAMDCAHLVRHVANRSNTQTPEKEKESAVALLDARA